jgi:hypothetical protein
MKTVIRQVSVLTAFDFEEIDIDRSHELQERFNDQVPVLFVDGRKAFKYRVTVEQLAKRISRKKRRFLTGIATLTGKAPT